MSAHQMKVDPHQECPKYTSKLWDKEETFQAARRKTGWTKDPEDSWEFSNSKASRACKSKGGIQSKDAPRQPLKQKQRIQTLETQVNLSSILLCRENVRDVPPPK